MKIITIIGARPQFIKAATVSRMIEKYEDIEEVIVHTGQHYDPNMSDIFFDEMQIPKPKYFLGIGGKSHGEMTGQMLEKIEKIVIEESPDFILVYGDTNSTLSGALVASKLHIQLAHVEAGLRSFNMKMPEEINRILTDRVSNLLFCPTDEAVNNLIKEGFENFDCEIIKSGDVMQEGALFYENLAKKPQIDIDNNFILCTIHRAENTNNEKRLIEILDALDDISKNKQILLPLHPRTKNIIESLNINVENITIINPVSYLEMLWLISHCDLVMTDSGGLQKEAYFLQKPCITLRDETEWVELVDNNYNVLAGADKRKIIDLYQNFQFNQDYSSSLFGDKDISKKIIEKLLANYY